MAEILFRKAPESGLLLRFCGLNWRASERHWLRIMPNIQDVKAKASELRGKLKQLDKLTGKGPTADDLAAHFGKSRQTIHEWRRRPNYPRNGTLKEVEEWVVANIKTPTGSEPSPLQQQLLEEKIRDTREAADKKALANAVKRGELIDAEDAARQLAIVMHVLRSRLEQIPDEARKEMPVEIRDAVAERVGDLIFLALKEVAAKLRGMNEQEGESDGGH